MDSDSNNYDDVNEDEYHVLAIRNNVNDEADENYNYITDTDQYENEARTRRPYSLLQRNSSSPPPIPNPSRSHRKEPVLYDIKNKYYYDKTKRGQQCIEFGMVCPQ